MQKLGRLPVNKIDMSEYLAGAKDCADNYWPKEDPTDWYMVGYLNQETKP